MGVHVDTLADRYGGYWINGYPATPFFNGSAHARSVVVGFAECTAYRTGLA